MEERLESHRLARHCGCVRRVRGAARAEADAGAVCHHFQGPLNNSHDGPRCSCALAAATTCSEVNPNFFARSLSGADAPKERMPMLCPAMPTYLAQPNVEACST